MNAPATPKSHSYQDALRSLLVFTLLLLCLILGIWFAVTMVYAGKQKAVVEEIENLGGLVWFDYQFDASGKEMPDAEPPGPPWLRRVLGDDFFTNVTKLYVRQFTDEKLEHLEALSQLRWLDLMETEVTDFGLEHLKGMTKLHTLNLAGANVTDAGLAHIRGLSQLESLDLDRTKVTDAGLQRIRGLTQLHTLSLRATKVTAAGVRTFQTALPNCKINH
jgi:Leucine Rich repeat